MIKAFEKAVGKEIKYQIMERRPGDIATCYADCTKAYNEIGFKATKTVDDMAQDAWRFQAKNPFGY